MQLPSEYSKSHAGWNAYAPSMLSSDDHGKLSRQRHVADAACWAPGTLGTRHWRSWEVCRDVRWLSWLIKKIGGQGRLVSCRGVEEKDAMVQNEWRNALFTQNPALSFMCSFAGYSPASASITQPFLEQGCCSSFDYESVEIDRKYKTQSNKNSPSRRYSNVSNFPCMYHFELQSKWDFILGENR